MQILKVQQIVSKTKRLLPRFGNVGAYLVLIVMLLAFIVPIAFMVVTSLKPEVAITSSTPTWDFTPILDNYRAVLFDSHALSYVANSAIICGLTTLVALLLGVPAAYGFARYEFRGKRNLEFWIISTRMMPPIALVLPFYIMSTGTPLFGTYWVMVLVYLLIDLPFVTWMMKGFFQQVPADLDDAALVDGCSRIGALWRVVLPLTRSGLVVTAFFSVVFAWNEFLYAFLMTTPNTWTVPVAMANIRSSVQLPWGQAAAFGVVGMILPLLFALAMQRYIIRGMTFGAMSGE